MGTAVELWNTLEPHRKKFLDRARVAAAVTVPYLLPPEAHSSGDPLADLYTSLGSKGVNNLASKLMLSLFPPDAPYFQLEPEAEAFANIPDDEQAAILATLRDMEDLITRDLESRGIRQAIYEALRHLLVAGNVVLHVPDEGPPSVFGLDRFVLQRDAKDNILRLLLLSVVPKDSVPAAADTLPSSFLGDDGEMVNVITDIKRLPNGDYSISQEIGDSKLEGTRTVSADRLPYKVVRLNKISGESYGRGFVDEHIGDLQTLEGLAQSLAEGVAISVDVKFLVDPQGLTDPADLEAAANGAYIPGRAVDVAAVQVGKALDLSVGRQLHEELTRELKQSFLLISGIQRNAERVTATEHQSLARELEASLGGIHPTLTAELSLPLIMLTMARLEEDEILPELEEGVLSPRVVTGVEALGRSQELARLQVASQLLQGLFGPNAPAQFLNLNATAEKIFAITGFNAKGLVKTEEQLQAEAQAQQQQELMSKATPNLVSEIGKTSREEPS